MADKAILPAMLQCKCPRCHQGNLFTHSAFNLRKFDNMYENCPVCQFLYEVELGFYWGAMYISYGFSVGLVVIIGFALYFLANDPDVWVYGLTVTVAIILFTPLLFRYARVVMLYSFGSVTFDPQYKKKI